MGSQTLELKWTDHKSNMTSQLQELYLSDALLDVTIVCGEYSLRAHKAVLSASSTFFRKLFINSPCKHPMLIMTDVDFEDLKTIVEFMYQGVVHISRGNLRRFLKIADRLMVKGLTSIEDISLIPPEYFETDVYPHFSEKIMEEDTMKPQLQSRNNIDVQNIPDNLTDSVESAIKKEILKLEDDTVHSDAGNCTFWENECFEQAFSSSKVPESNLSSLSTSHQQLVSTHQQHSTAISISPQVSTPSSLSILNPSVAHPLTSSSTSCELVVPSPLDKVVDSCTSHQPEVPFSDEEKYLDKEADSAFLAEVNEESTRSNIYPGNMYPLHDQSAVTVSTSDKTSFETTELLNGHYSQADERGPEIIVLANTEAHTLKDTCTNTTENIITDRIETNGNILALHETCIEFPENTIIENFLQLEENRILNSKQNGTSLHGKKCIKKTTSCRKNYRKDIITEISETSIQDNRRNGEDKMNKVPQIYSSSRKELQYSESLGGENINYNFFERKEFATESSICKLMKDLHTSSELNENSLTCRKVKDSTIDEKKNNRSILESHTGKDQNRSSTSGNSLTKGETLKNCKRVHSGETSFRCNVCRKDFSQKAKLKKHEKVHSGVKPYECKICGKRYSYMGNLKIHNMVHSGDRPYKCNICRKAFKQSCALKLHERIHTGEKPYECNTCGKKFSQNSNLLSHRMIHTGERPYMCDTCGKQFRWKSCLKVHGRIHIGEKPYECKTCGRTFSQRQSLHRHNWTHRQKTLPM